MARSCETSMHRMRALFPAVVVVGLVASSASQATDTRTTVRPGIEFLHRVTTNPAQDIYAARIDMSLPQVGLHASADARGTEWAVSTPTFARNTGSLIAINGDFSNISASGNDFLRPLGLAISGGVKWNDHIHDNTIGGAWGYFGCTIDKHCTANVERPLNQSFFFADPTKKPYRFFEAMGANGVPLINGGQAHTGCFDRVRNPRSAIGVEADGKHLWMVVIDGRRTGAAGMTCDETRQLMLNLGAADAVMLDGGGSSTLVVDGAVKNRPSDGSPRTVGNSFGITYQATPDASCAALPNGRYCTGSVITTCEGGQQTQTGDCGFFGATCQEDGTFAFCVHPFCPNHDGFGAACDDATHITSCNDGTLGTGDCGAFGLVCGSDSGGASCMEARCTAGPHSSFCTAAGKLATCTNGVYADAACPSGACSSDGGAHCPGAPPPPPPPPPDAGTPVDDAGAPLDDAGTSVDAGPLVDAGDPGSGDGDAGTGDPGIDDNEGNPDDASGVPLSPSVAGGCAQGPGSTDTTGALATLAALLLAGTSMRRRARGVRR